MIRSRHDLAVDDRDLVDGAVDAICRQGARVLERQRVLLDPAEALRLVGHDLLRADDEDDPSGATQVGPELRAAHRRGDERPGLGHRMDAAQHDRRSRREVTDLVALRGPVHAQDDRSDRLVPARLQGLGDAGDLERLRGAVMDLGALGDEVEDDAPGLGRVRGPMDGEPVGLQGPCGALDGRLIGDGLESARGGGAVEQVCGGVHGDPSFGRFWPYTCGCKHSRAK